MNSKHQSCWFNLRFLPSLSITCGMELLLLNHKTIVHRERKLEEHLFKVPGHSIQSILFTKKYTMTKIKSLLQIMTTQLDCRIFIYKNKLFLWFQRFLFVLRNIESRAPIFVQCSYCYEMWKKLRKNCE